MKILVVDDHALIREALRGVLKELKGDAVVLEASHSCMTIRGIRKADSICTTSAMRGAFKTNQSTRAELMALIYGSR